MDMGYSHPTATNPFSNRYARRRGSVLGAAWALTIVALGVGSGYAAYVIMLALAYVR
jgi:hypothetical protein